MLKGAPDRAQMVNSNLTNVSIQRTNSHQQFLRWTFPGGWAQAPGVRIPTRATPRKALKRTGYQTRHLRVAGRIPGDADRRCRPRATSRKDGLDDLVVVVESCLIIARWWSHVFHV